MLTFESMEKIAIASGKGGVGKTSITLMLAKYLNDKGYKVGLLDADISVSYTHLTLPTKA